MTTRQEPAPKIAFDLPPVEALAEAVDLHRAGDMASAERMYRQILTRSQDHADVLHLLGVLETQSGRAKDAIIHIEQAIDAAPAAANYHVSLGVALRAIGRGGDAAAAYRKAIALDPTFADAHVNLGNVLAESGDFAGAVASYERARELNPGSSKLRRRLAETYDRHGVELQQRGQPREAIERHNAAIAVDPEYSNAHHNLGVALQATGQLDDAAAAFRHAIAKDPVAATSHCNLGLVLTELGAYEAADAALHRALELDPHSVEAQNGLGRLLECRGESDAAVAAFDNAYTLDPGNAKASFNWAHALLKAGRAEEALAAFDIVIAQAPTLAKAHSNRGAALEALMRFEDAAEAYRSALSHDPDLMEARNNLAGVFLVQGRHEEAERTYREALERSLAAGSARAAAVHSNLLFAMSYNDAHDVASLAAEHARWQTLHARTNAAPAHANAADPERRLRIGYVSPDFRGHAVFFFISPLLHSHDRKAVEIFCYADVSRPDELTEQLRATADAWRDTTALSDVALAETIRADGIDILVDLAGHTNGNRLPAFALKPAPVQVSYLGYAMTTGLAAMDYKLTDRHMTPADTKEHFSEVLATLPDSFACYAPPTQAPDVGPLPALTTGHITFGCFNNLAKITPDVIALWSATLHAVEGSRLMLKAKALSDDATRERIVEKFAACDIGRDRLILRGHAAEVGTHLAAYNEVDIALDTFPYGGGTTTFEALWMGVPVVSLSGDRSTARLSLSFLATAGLGALATPDPRAFVHCAFELSSNLPRLADLRSRLRQRIAVSPLCDAPRFVRNMEDLYRMMWRRWCQSQARITPQAQEGAMP